MRILFLTHYFPPEGNAPATRVHSFAKRWVQAGHSVQVITCAPNVPNGCVYPGHANASWRHEHIDGIHVTRVWTFLAANSGQWKRMLNFASFMATGGLASLLVQRPDVVIATSPQLLCGLAGAVAARLRHIPFILEVRDLWPESVVSVSAMREGWTIRKLRDAAQWAYSQASSIVTVGPGYKAKLCELGVPASRITIIPNGVDLAQFDPGKEDTRLSTSDRYRVGYVGTLGLAAGLNTVVDAAHILKSRGDSSIQWVLAGDGADRAALAKRTAKKGVSTHVTFTGLLQKHEIPELLRGLDACLIHLRPEPLFETVIPSKFYEMAAMRRPVLMGVAGEAARLVEQAQCGAAFAPGDANALATLAQEWSRRPELTKRFGERGREFVAQHYQYDDLARRYIRHISAVVTNG